MSERVGREDVHHVAKLAHLALSAGEEQQLGRELSRILDWVRELDGLDTAAAEPTTHGASVAPRLREDAVAPSLGADRALAAAPEPLAGGFGVPKILE